MLSSITFQGISPKKINNTNAALSSKNKTSAKQDINNQDNIRFNPPFYKPLAFKGIKKRITENDLEASRKVMAENLDIVASDKEKKEGKVYLVRGPFLLDSQKQGQDRNNTEGNRSYQVFHKDGKYFNDSDKKAEIKSDMNEETEERMKHLRDNLGIDIIISLQCPDGKIIRDDFKVPFTEFKEDIDIERENAKKLGIDFVHLPLQPQGTAEEKDMKEFFELMQNVRNKGKRAYIHCKSGKDRTGVMSAIYLRELDVPADKVLDNHASRTKPISKNCPKMIETINTYEPKGRLT